jgi:hypothetical protein
MAGYQDEPQPPDAEVYIVDGDGSTTSGPRNRSPVAAGRRVGLVLGVAAVFVLGVLVGRTSLSTRTAATNAPTTVTITSPSSAPPPASTSMSPAAITAPSTGGQIQWPLAHGACGRATPQPLIDGAQPLAASVAMQLIAGGDPAPIDLGRGTVGSAAFQADADHVVTAVATARDALVLLVSSCDGGGPGRVVRIPAGGKATDVELPKDTRRATLVSGGDRVWVAASPGSYGFGPVTLIAADGSGDTATLPGGMEPLSAVGRRIIGQFASGGLSGGLFGVFDTDRGDVVAQFGAPQEKAVNAVADGDYVITSPWVCGAACEVRRYTISTAAELSVRLTPASDALLSGGGAISPNGILAAIPLFAQPPSPQPFDPYTLGTDRPNDTTRVGLLDLGTGSVRALPGLTLGAGMSPALAFSPDGRWIIVAVGEGYRTRLLLYTSDGDGPYDPDIDIPGLVPSPPAFARPADSGHDG